MTALDDAIDSLAGTLAETERLYLRAKLDAEEWIERHGMTDGGRPLTAEQLKDTNGRPLLLDAALTLSQAKAALANAEAVRAEIQQ